MSDQEITKHTIGLLTSVRGVVGWLVDKGHVEPEKLRLTVQARKEAAAKLIADGLSQREAAEALGVAHTTIQRDLAQDVPQNGTERAAKAEQKRAERLARNAEIAENNTKLPVGERKYSVIYADPPWSFQVWSGAGKDRAAENHYPTMTQAEIEALSVSELAADDCALFLWAVMPQIPEALRVIEAWGFSYKTCAFVWVKQTKDEERFATGMGYWTRADAEICLLATRGSPPRLNADVHQVVLAPRIEHSKKPDEIVERIQRLVPGPYIELFARSSRNGWDSWGNQA